MSNARSTASTHVLALDLGTSRIKVALVNEALRVVASASTSHPTFTQAAGMAEQRTEDWLEGIGSAVAVALASLSSPAIIDAIVLTAQMPTLVALSETGPLDRAVTWQDSRANDLVLSRLLPQQRRRLYEISGTPIDGRYIIPMHLRRLNNEGYRPSTILSAKDYMLYVLTGELVTDPSTASGYGNFDLATRDWSDELTALWGISRDVLPRVGAPSECYPLNDAGARLLAGIPARTPVFVGAADSVCAHHFVSAHFERPISVIDGSSTVILASLDSPHGLAPEILLTPLADPSRAGAELDLLATGSSIAWLARLFCLEVRELEALALAHPSPSRNATLFYPYLAGGEQGALWRSDIAGGIEHVSLATTREDLCLALYEGIAFETARCVRLLESVQRYDTVVSIGGATSQLLGASLLGAVLDLPVVALARHSPSLLGAALIALEASGADTGARRLLADEVPDLADHYTRTLADKLSRYLTDAPATKNPADSPVAP